MWLLCVERFEFWTLLDHKSYFYLCAQMKRSISHPGTYSFDRLVHSQTHLQHSVDFKTEKRIEIDN